MDDGTGSVSVTVPDDLVPVVLDSFTSSTITIDPYRDQVLGRADIRKALDRLELSRREAVAALEGVVRQGLSVRELPEWATGLLNARTTESEFLYACVALIRICEHALERDTDVRILGQ